MLFLRSFSFVAFTKGGGQWEGELKILQAPAHSFMIRLDALRIQRERTNTL
jgi:hypothetical protein